MTITDTPTTTTRLISELQANPENLRTDLGDLDELVASINALGIIQPILITPEGLLLDGHRRLAAAAIAGLVEVPVTERVVADDAEVVEIMLVSALQRSGLNPIEEGTGYARLADMGMSQREIAERVGCNQSHVSKRITLTELPDAAQAKVVDGSLQINDAITLVTLFKADADSANEWLGGQRWPDLNERLRRARVEVQRQSSLAEGRATKLPYVDFITPMHGILPTSEGASCWHVTHDGSLVWLETLAAAPTTKPETKKPNKTTPEPAKPSGPAPWEIQQQKTRDRRERREETMAVAVEHVGRERFVAMSFEQAVRTVADSMYDLFVDTGALPDDLDQDDHALVVAWRLMRSMVDDIGLTDPTDVDRWALAFLVELGYDLDEEEQAALGDFVVPKVVTDAEWSTIANGPLAGLTEAEAAAHIALVNEQFVEEIKDAHDEPVDEDDARAIAEADQWMEAKPPWSAYPFVDDTKLIGAIREHGNVTKLDYALEYERANKNRPAVIAALSERVLELT